MKPGQRVAFGSHKGTIVEPDESWFVDREHLRNKKSSYYFVQFDGPGPYGDGRGIYAYTTMMLRMIRE